MDEMTLDERCAELKSRMLAERDRGKDLPVPAAPAAVLNRPTPQPSRLRGHAQPPEVPTGEFRNSHPIVRAALAAKNDVPEDHGKLQFRRGGYADVRVSRPLVRRALKTLDILFKQLEKEGVQVQIAQRERSFYQGLRRQIAASKSK
jgi:hypothetical protein